METLLLTLPAKCPVLSTPSAMSHDFHWKPLAVCRRRPCVRGWLQVSDWRALSASASMGKPTVGPDSSRGRRYTLTDPDRRVSPRPECQQILKSHRVSEKPGYG